MGLRDALTGRRRRREFIAGYTFPASLGERLRAHHPHLSDDQAALVLDGLREWFLVCLEARGRVLGMPSRAVDAAWHEFILMTREYTAFCERAFGRYLHHTPEGGMDEPMGDAVARTAALATAGIPTAAVGLPLLFAVDAAVGVPGATDWSAGQVAERAEHGARSRTDGGAGCGGGFATDGGGDGGCGGGCGGG